MWAFKVAQQCGLPVHKAVAGGLGKRKKKKEKKNAGAGLTCFLVGVLAHSQQPRPLRRFPTA